MATKKKAATAGLRVPVPEQVKLSALQFAPYNPRILSRETMASLKASLVKHGMVLTLVVQRQSEAYGKNVLVGGHQRVRAMRELCAERGWPEPETVPAVMLDVGDAEAKQLNVSLNNIEAEFDPYKLGEMFRDIAPTMTADDYLAVGFQAEQIQEMVQLLVPPDDAALALEGDIGDLSGFGASITLSIEFETVKARDEAKALLKSASAKAGKKAGDLMLRAVKASDVVGRLLDGPRHKGVDGKGKSQGKPARGARA